MTDTMKGSLEQIANDDNLIGLNKMEKIESMTEGQEDNGKYSKEIKNQYLWVMASTTKGVQPLGNLNRGNLYVYLSPIYVYALCLLCRSLCITVINGFMGFAMNKCVWVITPYQCRLGR